MKTMVFVGYFFVQALTIHAQEAEITVVGRVADAHTHKGVLASIRYSSIPTGSIFGRFNDSTFTFPIFGTAKYQITAAAKGFNPRTVIVDPKDIDANRQVVRDIELTPSG